MSDKPANRKKRWRHPFEWSAVELVGELIGVGLRLLFRAIGRLLD